MIVLTTEEQDALAAVIIAAPPDLGGRIPAHHMPALQSFQRKIVADRMMRIRMNAMAAAANKPKEPA